MIASFLSGGLPGWQLNPTFQEMLRHALTGGGDPWIVYGDLDRDKHGRDAKFLDQYAQERWDCVLHYMVGSEVSSHRGISFSPDEFPKDSDSLFMDILLAGKLGERHISGRDPYSAALGPDEKR